MEDVWASRLLPILRTIATSEATDEGERMTIGDVADRTGLDPREVAVELERLLERAIYGAGSTS